MVIPVQAKDDLRHRGSFILDPCPNKPRQFLLKLSLGSGWDISLAWYPVRQTKVHS